MVSVPRAVRLADDLAVGFHAIADHIREGVRNGRSGTIPASFAANQWTLTIFQDTADSIATIAGAVPRGVNTP